MILIMNFLVMITLTLLIQGRPQELGVAEKSIRFQKGAQHLMPFLESYKIL